MPEVWLSTLKSETPQSGFELAVKMSRVCGSSSR
jgi:hypothetical protein